MSFYEKLVRAKQGEAMAIEEIFMMYRPLLIKEAISYGVFDEDLYQELCLLMFLCVQKFNL